MSRLLHFAIFFSMLSLILGGAQYYVFHRITHYFTLPPQVRTTLAVFLSITAITMICALPLLRLVSREVAIPFIWLGFGWMGFLMFLVLGFIIADILLFVHYLATLSSTSDTQGRRQFLKHLLGGTIIAGTSMVGALGIRNVMRDVVIKPVTITLDTLGASLDGMSIVQLSDVHIGPTLGKTWLERVVETTNSLTPDIIVITGDLVDGTVEELREHVAPLANLRAKHGVYFSTGNHEYYSGVEAWKAHLPTLGIRVLANEGLTLHPRDTQDALFLAGVEDYHAHQTSLDKQDIPAALATRNPAHPCVLLAHQPIAIHEAAQHGVDLQLSGHTHGGQIFPFNYAVYAQQPYVKGLHTYPNTRTQIYVSSGTGYWGPPMRVGTSCEITRITLCSNAPL